VVRIIDNEEMTASAEALVKRLRLSGFCGFDFVLSPTGRAYLIEMNARATPVCHLALAGQTSLAAALYRAVTGREPMHLAAPLQDKIVALFPTEWERDPASPLLSQAFHDAPWDEPRLLMKVGML
jgi:predicted ATP-grasp superfamily ATP-dependent carboligase